MLNKKPKTIVIGLDGGDFELLSKFNFKFIQKLKCDGAFRELSVPEYNRGWANVITGKNAEETGAVYYYPNKNSYILNNSFNSLSYGKDNGFKPLWQTLSSNNISCGFLNVPTTFPAPQCGKFFVSGAGGGQKMDWSKLVFPEEVKLLSRELGYNPDARVSTQNHVSFIDVILELNNLEVARKNLFLKLIEKYNPDFSFLVFVGLDRIGHLLYRNIEKIQTEGANTSLDVLILEHFNLIDSLICEIADKFKYSNIIITSDHGMSPYRKNFDANFMLTELGFLKTRSEIGTNAFALIKKIARNVLPVKAKTAIKKSSSKINGIASSEKYDFGNSRAFAFRYVNGIFINSKERFPRGIVKKDDCVSVANEIIDYIESNLGFNAYYSEPDKKLFDYRFPDIVIELPCDVFPRNSGNSSVLEKNQFYQYYEDKIPVKRDILNGIHYLKSFCLASGPDILRAQDAFRTNELREVHNFILKIYDI